MKRLKVSLIVVALAVSLAAASTPEDFDQGSCPGAEQGCEFNQQYWQEGPNSWRLINGSYGVSWVCLQAPTVCTWTYVYCPQWGTWKFIPCRIGAMCNIANNCYGPPPVADEKTTQAAMQRQRDAYMAKLKAKQKGDAVKSSK